MRKIQVHMVPQIIQDHAVKLNDNSPVHIKDRYAQILEETIAYCQDVLTRYNNKR